MTLTQEIVSHWTGKGWGLRALALYERRAGREIFVRPYDGALMVIYRWTATGGQEYLTHEQAKEAN